jgi:hypothetical protein
LNFFPSPSNWNCQLATCQGSSYSLKLFNWPSKYQAGADKGIRLLPMEDFISLFLRMPCHQKCFETVNETTPKMHDFILEFHNTKFYVVPLVVVSLVVYEMK